MSLRIAFVEPHLKRYGGIRRIVELSNGLVARGHDVTLFVPSWERPSCDWMRCDAEVRRLEASHPEPYDVVVYNQESQWYLLDRFTGARTRGFYALHYARLYDKEGSWECLRFPVDLSLANSTWTADMIEEETGRRPTVLLGGVNADHFRPLDVPKRYPLLCVGDDREWKGTSDIEAAARRLGLPLERYAGKDLPQERMAAEYGAAEVFVVGSHFEGFGQPGLEALACGTPLVTTDNGGCRDYAIHEETALVVPPRDVDAMAEAIARLRGDRELAARLSANALELLQERFRWPLAAERFEGHVSAALEAVRDDPRPAVERFGTRRPDGWTVLREPEPSPDLSVVVLAWDQLTLTQRCVESIRQHTDVPYELVLVDNGSAPDAADYARQAGDVVVMNGDNHGFAGGMNDGLRVASGRRIAFVNNDTRLPVGWASRLLETAEAHPSAGVVVPALTAAGNDRTVRDEPGEDVLALRPFEAPPSAVVYLMATDLVRELGGWDESYAIASGEDLDLAFSVWVNDLDIVYDARVLVDHVGHGTSDAKLEDRSELWARNRKQFLDRWSDPEGPVPRLAGTPDERFVRNRATASATAEWMARYFRQRDRAAEVELQARRLSEIPRLDQSATVRRVVRSVWPRIRSAVPAPLRLRLFRRFRTTYYRYFPDRHPAALRGEAPRKSSR